MVKAERIQWDYKHIVKRKRVLLRLKKNFLILFADLQTLQLWKQTPYKQKTPKLTNSNSKAKALNFSAF